MLLKLEFYYSSMSFVIYIPYIVLVYLYIMECTSFSSILYITTHTIYHRPILILFAFRVKQQLLHFGMKYSHSFYSLAAGKGPSFF